MCAAHAAYALTDIAQAPINFLLSSPAKPNIFFILDDSSSMNWSYLGDEVMNQHYENAIGYRNSLCNKIYYDPAVKYPAPVDANGNAYADQNFNAALYDGFQANSLKIDLSNGFMPWRNATTLPPLPQNTADTYYASDCFSAFASCNVDVNPGLPNTPEAAHYFVYRGDKRDHLGDNTADDHCKDSQFDTGTGGMNHWTKVIVGTASGPNGKDETTNFANWFSYYRTRILMMKTAVGRAFRQLDNNYRVGYSAISEPGVDSTLAGFLKISDFEGNHRNNFYQKLYAVKPASSTPLRGALSKAGRLYAGKLLTGSDDPIQYSCQQNYTLLSTDGYWNSQGETPTYGPKKIDGVSNVGNQDDQLPRPLYDGSGKKNAYSVATLTIEARHTETNPVYTVLYSIRVNGQDLMSQLSYVMHQSNANLMSEAAQLAYYISQQINLNGYRAFSDNNQVMIIAPASAGNHIAAPVIHAEGSFPISMTSFSEVSGSQLSINTLADIAAYYFQNDLRQSSFSNCGPSNNLCDNNVPSLPGTVQRNYQHMLTHTLGLGADGTLHYQENYEQATTGDFSEIVKGTRDWPDPIFNSGPERIDDLWHAAVNGGGKYFSAHNPESLSRSLSSSLAAIIAATGAASAAATSSQEPAEGDNLLFSSRYRSLYWDGDLEARKINLNDGSVSDTIVWSAASGLSKRAGLNEDDRTLYIPSASSATGLKNFLWTELNTTERQFFTDLCGSNPLHHWSQCGQFSVDQKNAAGGVNLVNYLRGQKNNEDRPDNTMRLFRPREQVLGAPVNAQSLYVGRPEFRYADDNYGAFRDVQMANRKGMVYLAANDGMLHAFDASSGREDWAFIPGGVLPELWRSADPSFAKNFKYLLDGTPVAGDICPGAATAGAIPLCTSDQWRTILVGGLGAAGREYYALDVTDPASPSLLWRFTADNDNQLGIALGKPIITKRRNGEWVVVIASGYNNINPGSGKGSLFVLNASTGRLLKRIDTSAGSADTPAGLAQINAWVDTTMDNTADRIYGGDLLGNIWRFDINDPLPVNGAEAVLLGQFTINGQPQAITTRPELSSYQVGNIQIPLITVATGRYLGVSDVQDKSVQSVYTIKDKLSTVGLGDIRQDPAMVRQVLNEGSTTAERKASSNTVDWILNDGWYVDLDVAANSGERVNLDPEQQMGILRIVSNVPDSTVCRPHAESWLYAFDYLNGSYIQLEATHTVARKVTTSSIAAGSTTVKIGEKTVSLITDESGNIVQIAAPVPAAGTQAVRRVSWRELDEQ